MPKHDDARTPTISATRGKHTLFHADSRRCNYSYGFNLLLTSPPYYHPTRTSSKHGIGITGELEHYASGVAETLLHCSQSVIGKRVCFLKTDVWYRGTLIPVAYEIMTACVKRGLRLRAHWIWQRLSAFSPYGPGLSNIFVFGDDFSRPRFSGLISDVTVARKSRLPSSFVPEIFGELIELLTQRGDIVLDPFSGAGGVIEAAETHGRRAVGVELSSPQIRAAVDQLKRIRGFLFQETAHSSLPRRCQ